MDTTTYNAASKTDARAWLRALAWLLLLVCLALRAAPGQSVDSCRPYPYLETANACYLDFVAPWWVVQNVQEAQGDLRQGKLGVGWKVSLFVDNPTNAFMQVEYEIFRSQGGGVESAPVLAYLDGNFVTANGSSLLRGLTGATFVIPPGTSERHWLVSASDDQGNPTNDLLAGSMRVRIYAHDAATMDQVADKFNGTVGNYVRDPASGSLTTKYLGKLDLRRVDSLTTRAYTDIIVTPQEQRSGQIAPERAAIAVNNFSPSPQTVTIRLKGPSGNTLTSTPLTLAGGGTNGVGGESTGFLIDELFPVGAFTLQGEAVFRGQVEVESGGPIALFVWHVIGDAATSIPWWPMP
jgi:hypothetical protein